jgi:hypothetical protein
VKTVASGAIEKKDEAPKEVGRYRGCGQEYGEKQGETERSEENAA